MDNGCKNCVHAIFDPVWGEYNKCKLYGITLPQGKPRPWYPCMGYAEKKK